MAPTVDSHCLPVPLASAQSWANFLTALGMAFGLGSKKAQSSMCAGPTQASLSHVPRLPS